MLFRLGSEPRRRENLRYWKYWKFNNLLFGNKLANASRIQSPFMNLLVLINWIKIMSKRGYLMSFTQSVNYLQLRNLRKSIESSFRQTLQFVTRQVPENKFQISSCTTNKYKQRIQLLIKLLIWSKFKVSCQAPLLMRSYMFCSFSYHLISILQL